MREGDANPERILLDLELVEAASNLKAGARIGAVTGVLEYAFGNYRIQVRSARSRRQTSRPAGPAP
jgi:predicted extracellular nuclease